MLWQHRTWLSSCKYINEYNRHCVSQHCFAYLWQTVIKFCQDLVSYCLQIYINNYISKKDDKSTKKMAKILSDFTLLYMNVQKWEKKVVKQCCDITKPDCTHCYCSGRKKEKRKKKRLSLWSIVSFEVYEANEFSFSLFKGNTYLLIMLKQRHEFKLDIQISWNYFCNSTLEMINILLLSCYYANSWNISTQKYHFM